MNKLSLCLLVFVGFTCASKDKNTHQNPFSDSGIVPDVLHKPPTNLLRVEYKSPGKVVEMGNELTPKQVREQPIVTYNGDPKAFFTLVMSDPDAPSRKGPAQREWNHWLVGNIPGSDISKGQVISEYVGSGPPKDSGLHRYVFVLYKQKAKIDFKEPLKNNRNSHRGKFSTENFAKKYGLGDPVAANYFQAKYDDSVPELYKQFDD